jgi:hypothetical protein
MVSHAIPTHPWADPKSDARSVTCSASGQPPGRCLPVGQNRLHLAADMRLSKVVANDAIGPTSRGVAGQPCVPTFRDTFVGTSRMSPTRD